MGEYPDERVVLGRREKSMIGFRWSRAEPSGLSDVEVAEGLGATWEGNELVTYDLPASRACTSITRGTNT